MSKKISKVCFKILKWLVRLFYPKIEIVGLENLPQEPAMIVGNHTQMHGPITAEIHFPGAPYIWCAGQMMHLKEVPAYAFQDFWSEKPKSVRWLYKLFSYVIAPISVCVFNNARTIPVYKDTRVVSTFKEATAKLIEGNNEVVFPEYAEPHNHIVNEFQDKFIDVARFYYKKTGKELSFVPMYMAPKLKRLYLGSPTQFRHDAPIEDERKRICEYLMNAITEIAVNLPKHTVVPYKNLPKKQYPTNRN